MPVSKVCPVCGSTFDCKPTEAQRRICCSKECDAKSRSNNPGQVWSEFECEYCRKTYRIRTYRAVYQHHFCSRHCHSMWNKSRYEEFNPAHICEICGSQFRRARFFGLVRGNVRFCSRKCLDKFNSINKQREKNVNWTGGGDRDYGPNWLEQRRKTRERDGNVCQLCGKHMQKWKLDIHHITPFRVFGFVTGANENYLAANDLNNLVTLCRSCHLKVEHNPQLLSR